jgi:DsbC/DsbD-like thiol-disulfide interchange protein
MKTLVAWLGILALPFAANAQKKPGEAASIAGVEIKGDAVAGRRVTAVVKVKLEKGYHVHSNKPSQPEFIPTVLTLEPGAGVKAGTIGYPTGKSEKVAGLDKPLSIYEDHFEVSVPLGLAASVKLPLTVPATLNYQACQGAKCYAPQQLKFEIRLPAAP